LDSHRTSTVRPTHASFTALIISRSLLLATEKETVQVIRKHASEGPTTVAVKITDMLGEEVLKISRT
jgi:hypothetical protein